MDELRNILETNLNKDFLAAVLSNPRNEDQAVKVKVRPVRHKGRLMFQTETFQNKQVFHENLNAVDTAARLMEYMGNFRQMQIETSLMLYTVLVSKKGKITIKKKQNASPRSVETFSHNRKKNYILEEGEPIPFLVDLGVMTQEGKIVHSKFDKFRQINRFLEFIEDISENLPKDREMTVLDFGCGKSYLTFAMYYYLHEMKRYDVRIIGLDLKEEVIRRCGELAVRYGYRKLSFLKGDIAHYAGADKIDMVVTLHACDTATDYALEKAVGWEAKVILSVPCCQHELNAQLKETAQCKDDRLLALEPIMKYGLLKERMAALVTDGLRAQYLERAGYYVQVLEFIDMEHTPKNILIRAVKMSGTEGKKRAGESIKACEEFFHISPTIGRLLDR
ncbi:MAG: SAM-dependent methyltransferase [Dorea sp.]|jgi:SAM-dependent methyltransferase|nr:SAM-dependent methyltransferase [Dorea sp.]